MKLKVCGVRDAAIAVEAARLGFEYFGLIFEPSSPRNVTRAEAKTIRAAVRAACGIRAVGVFVRQTTDEIGEIVREVGLDVIQLHRRATAAEVSALSAAGCEVWTLAGGAPADGVLFDSSHGDGETQLVRGSYKTILAGGISVDNLPSPGKEPDVLDVNSSLETAPGVKSIARLQAFAAAVSRLPFFEPFADSPSP